VTAATPKELVRVGDRAFRIVWDDGHESVYPARLLRERCPCAGCRDEWTGRPLLDPSAVPGDLALKDARLVGNYAIQFAYTDGHSTGLYTFEFLRRGCPCPACSDLKKI
jgi:DUF971 family protein